MCVAAKRRGTRSTGRVPVGPQVDVTRWDTAKGLALGRVLRETCAWPAETERRPVCLPRERPDRLATAWARPRPPRDVRVPRRRVAAGQLVRSSGAKRWTALPSGSSTSRVALAPEGVPGLQVATVPGRHERCVRRIDVGGRVTQERDRDAPFARRRLPLRIEAPHHVLACPT